MNDFSLKSFLFSHIFSLRSAHPVLAMMKTAIVLLCLLHAYAMKNNIVCPDGKSMCFDEETCCLMTSGEYGCCPLPLAVCCEDKVHCCPYGYTCNLQRVTCDKAGHQIPMLEHKESKSFERKVPVEHHGVNNVICPDKVSYCHDGNTCCKKNGGGYSCCPLPEATCCSDNVHCCPNGYTCDLSAGRCILGNHFLEMRMRTSAMQVVGTRTSPCLNGKDHCSNSETCCLMQSGEYGCCPMENSVCCPDRRHCCPHGFTCDGDKSSCKSQDLSVPYIAITQKKKRKEHRRTFLASLIHRTIKKNFFCPDHFSQCPEGFTCCKGLLGLWECCPLPNATCCTDHKHCCPSGTICNIKSGSCTPKGKNRISIPWKRKVNATKGNTTSVLCPDRESYCPTGYTCCLLSSGMYGCCPYTKAVCCSDHVHCCPHGTICDTNHTACISDSTMPFLDFQKDIPAIRIQQPVSNILTTDFNSQKITKYLYITCPDHSACPDGFTCCKLPTSGYGCCSYAQAVCCSDGLHCCPHGTTCDVAKGTCVRSEKDSSTVALMVSKVRRPMVKCEDGSVCPGTETCCKLASGGYGCCPYEEAVCCSDGLHCCPHGTTCDVAKGTCVRSEKDSSTVALMVSKVRRPMVKCEDGSVCPGTETCCKLASGGYGCCPYEEAVCCSDGLHCCPHGTTCDVAKGTCVRSEKDSSTAALVVSKVRRPMVKCEDGSVCPGTETCCKLASGGYGCCPYEEAVCCSDGLHCCPHGTTCDVAKGTCVRSEKDSSTAALVVSKVRRPMVKCEDGSVCPGTETCCKLASGGYGCCPYEEAVCCSDGLHCCPHGTTCDVAKGTCVRSEKDSSTVALMVSKVRRPMVKCEDGSVCPGTETCCKLASGGYGCCPYEEAVCCSDGLHCCPHGTTCDVAKGTCVRSEKDSSTVALMVSKVRRPMVKCEDGSVCPGTETCCKLASGGYGCCPYEEAVCCSDGLHCCPHGTTCDVAKGTCVRSEKDSSTVALMVSKVRRPMVKCEDGSVCPGTETCCKLASGGYGCCPYEEAVCCSDGLHCCPHGTTCDVAKGTCVRSEKDSSTVALMVSKVRRPMVKCEDGSVCPGTETCCKLASGGYGCCPYEEAVCCSDGLHCCPHGTTCDVAKGTCVRSEKDSSTVALMVSKVRRPMVKCEDGSVCPGTETCCKLASGGYGCCPYEEAVCCSDGLHCCPHGTTCDVAKGTCVRSEKDSSTAALMVSKVRRPMVKCEDGSVCPGTETCCKLASGGYGCCPYEEAVCCSDGLHCCPHGTTCDVAKGTCVRSEKDSSTVALMVSKVRRPMVKCEDGSVCPGTETCCKLASGGYGCCPYEEAVCCSDGLHCCPHGTTCDVAKGTCVRSEKDSSTAALMVSKVRRPMVKCEDGSVCPGTETCCKLASGGYGCCPYEEAVCCSDGLHCCPHGTTCDVAKGTCVRSEKDSSTAALVVSKVRRPMVKCEDGSVCPGTETCCKLASGGYGCCPYEEAVCCSDGLHCCPHGTTCDVAKGTCVRSEKDSSTVALMVSKVRRPMVKCEDGSVCPGTETCCKLASGGYGCCPYEEAVCCSDGLHCCPHGTTCDVAKGTCVRSEKDSSTVALMVSKVRRPMVKCEDGSVCPGTETCCKLASGGYGCCPYEEAVCCSDGLHCCPHGTTCDVAKGTCVRSEKDSSTVALMVSKVRRPMVKCEDGSVCPGTETCCKLASGGYGCCPYEEAVCCSDGLHCCPHGTTCDVAKGTCVRSEKDSSTVALVVSKVRRPMVKCEDGSVCPGTETCCKLASGGYGCCPYEEAVCCSDGLHCCPHGTTCDVAKGTCVRSEKDSSTAALMVSKVRRPMVKCEDGSVCPGTETCCKLASGGYGCCPYEEAVCCSDGLHCCPHGTTCDVAKGTCVRSEKDSSTVALMVSKVRRPMVKCEDGSVCPGTETCCKLASGGYGCCPYEEAVCCSDGLHCCPHGTTCDVAKGTCVRSEKDSSTVALMVSKVRRPMVKCEDGSVCPGTETCCKLASGGYGCCPYEEAVCCSDGLHCCPHGTTCDVAKGTCVRSEKDSSTAALVVSKVRRPMVKCEDGSVCPGTETCCKLASGGYGCCPYEEAVCCSDGLHCCPHGTTCDVAKGTCVRSEKDSSTVALVVSKVRRPMVKCEDGSVCPGTETCCKLASGGYGCCPYEEAVCCSDGLHCCPHRTKCDVRSGTCIPGYDMQPHSVKLLTLSLVTCPDEFSLCPDNWTCCKLPSGGYGCCQYKNATCCEDHLHCCPSGFKCVDKSQQCSSSGVLYPMKAKLPSLRNKNGMGVKCDKFGSCPTGYTCCKTSSGRYGCCPFVNATCCQDMLHCCPQGTTCDLASLTCQASSVMMAHDNPGKVSVGDVICPDDISSCPTGYTCCKLSSGDYGCCPLRHAVCCKDGVHCCPEGTTCDLTTQTCISGAHRVAMHRKLKSFRLAQKRLTHIAKSTRSSSAKSVICPGGKSMCKDGWTCCLIDDHDYGCCPFENATCCSDRKHCCPSGYRCGPYGMYH